MDGSVITLLVVISIVVIVLSVVFALSTRSSKPKVYEDKEELITDKGELGEHLVEDMLMTVIDFHGGYSYRQLRLEDDYGNWTEIDNVLVSNIGIFLIETKNMGGTISGSDSDKKWKQVINDDYVNIFPNPVIQNHRHVNFFNRVIKGCGYVNSLVVFIDADISQVSSKETYLLEKVEDYLIDKKRLFSDSKVEYINNQIKKYIENPPCSHEEYANWVKNSFGKSDQ